MEAQKKFAVGWIVLGVLGVALVTWSLLDEPSDWTSYPRLVIHLLMMGWGMHLLRVPPPDEKPSWGEHRTRVGIWFTVGALVGVGTLLIAERVGAA